MCNNKTKIIATIGPASSSYEVLNKMMDAGVNVCRLNASHGNHQIQKEIIDNIRLLNEERQSHVAILYDLQGPKIRVGEVENNGVELINGNTITLTINDCIGTAEKVYVKYPSFLQDVKTGDRILIDDGKLELKIVSNNNIDSALAEIVNGGTLSSKKGLNLPNTRISLPSLTEKDKVDLEFALENNVEWIGLSFIRSAKDIEALKNIIKYKNKTARTIAKIEKPEAVVDIDNIIAVSDGVMVARGDLGVEIPMEEVPLYQKMIVKKCIAAAKPVIIATQMMESMITSQRPTRAEVNDVGNSVLDGADAVMLSAETSVGKDPVNVVEHMYRIIRTVQNDPGIYFHENAPQRESATFISDSTTYNACVIAKQVGATGITTMTHSGYSAIKIASHRPNCDILVFTDNKLLLTQLNLVWGVRGFFYDKYENTDTNITDIKNLLVQKGLVKPGNIVIHVYSTPLMARGRANSLKINVID